MKSGGPKLVRRSFVKEKKDSLSMECKRPCIHPVPILFPSSRAKRWTTRAGLILLHLHQRSVFLDIRNKWFYLQSVRSKWVKLYHLKKNNLQRYFGYFYSNSIFKKHRHYFSITTFARIHFKYTIINSSLSKLSQT